MGSNEIQWLCHVAIFPFSYVKSRILLSCISKKRLFHYWNVLLQSFSHSLDRKQRAARAALSLVSQIKCILNKEYLLTWNILILPMIWHIYVRGSQICTASLSQESSLKKGTPLKSSCSLTGMAFECPKQMEKVPCRFCSPKD